MFDIYIHDIKDFIFKSLEQIDNAKVIVYIIYFFIYFLLYYIITVPKLMNDIQNNQLFTKIDELSKKKWFIIFIGIIDVLLIISLIVLLYKYIKNRNKVTEQQKLYIVTIPIAIIAFIL